MDTTHGSLLGRIRDPRNEVAWREFDAIYRPMLYRFARARQLEHADAEDVVQYCMAAIQKYIGEFQYDPSKGRFKGWLRTMVRNRVRMMLRKQSDDVAQTKDFKRPQQREPAPEEVFDELWMEEHLKHALDRLRQEVNESSFRAFDLYVFQEWPVEKVCEELDMSADQVYAIKYRLTKKLRTKMKDLTDGLE
jgi:RNA polymerase sigma-70 factor (ECF subfamily)